MKKNILILMFLINLLAFGKKEKLEVFTSILPQKYFVEQIGGERVNVQVLVKSGKSPATYEVTPKQIIELNNAKILFTIGVPFEKVFLKKIGMNLKITKIVDTSYEIEKRYLKYHSHDNHQHNLKTKDPHIWMSPILVKTQAKKIYSTLIKEDPEGKGIYEKRYKKFIEELDELDRYLKNKLNPYKGNTIFVYHPAFGYFTDEYGLYQEAIETGGKEPVPAMLEKVIQHAKEEEVKIIFVQPEFSQKSANAIAKAIDGRVVSLNPLNPDYINNMKKMADEIEGALKNE